MSFAYSVQKVDSANQAVSAQSSSDVLARNISGNGRQVQDNTQETNIKDIKQTQQRTQNELDTKLKSIIEDFDISMEEIKKILDYCGYDNDRLLRLYDSEFSKLERCISTAIGFVSKDCKVNKEALPLTLLNFKFCIVDRGLGSSKAIEEVKANANKDLFDIIQGMAEQNEDLKKILNGRNASELSAEELKNIFKQALNKMFNNKEKTPEAYMDAFMVALDKCDDKEKAKIFHAFALLLKDDSAMKELVPDMYKKLTTTYGDMKELAKLINKIGPEILGMLGFDKSLISLINLETLKGLDDKQLQGIVDSFLKAFQNIPEEDLPKLKEIIQSINNGNANNLTQEQLNIWKKYAPLIQQTVKFIAQTAQDPNLAERLQKYMEPLMQFLNQSGLETGIMGQVQIYFEQHKDIFNNISKDDFAKLVNKLTNNKYSEAIGDTNPDNLYKKDNNTSENTTKTIGFEQKSNAEEVTVTKNNSENLKAQVTEEPVESITVEPNKRSKTESQPQFNFIKSHIIRNVENFNTALAEGLIKIDDAGKDFNNACKSVQLKVINFLDGQKNKRLDILNKWHNSQLIDVAANKFNFTIEQIEKLQLSIGKKQVMINEYELKHRTDEEQA